jgi:hypothetical protein
VAAKEAALEARTAVGEALTELQLLTEDPRVLELAAHVVDFTHSLHEAPTGPTATGAPRRPGRTQRLRRRLPARTGLSLTLYDSCRLRDTNSC